MSNDSLKTVIRGQKRLRCGYTTGTCAAAAAKAATSMLLSGKPCREVLLVVPAGDHIVLEAEILKVSPDVVQCGVIKDAGDDPDITNGLMVCAAVSRCDGRDITIDGGEGVGRVTKNGLDQPVGAAAINSVPRKMIREAVESERRNYGYTGGISVLITVPGGKEQAKKTLNGMLGIEGGLSILGTSGIVEPMSERALIDTIGVEIRMRVAQQEKILIMAPGNYGMDFLKDQYGIASDQVVKISNYVGESVDMAVCEGVFSILLAGHIGKLIKVAGGIMNTHSHQADARMEILTAYSAVAGVPTQVLQQIMRAVTTDAGLDILKEAGFMEQTMALVTERIRENLQRRAGANVSVGVIMFSNAHGLLGQTENAEELLRKHKQNVEKPLKTREQSLQEDNT